MPRMCLGVLLYYFHISRQRFVIARFPEASSSAPRPQKGIRFHEKAHNRFQLGRKMFRAQPLGKVVYCYYLV